MNRKKSIAIAALVSPLLWVVLLVGADAADSWPQLQGNAARSGDAPHVAFETPLGLVAAVPLSDGVYAAPVVSDGIVYVMDGSGVVFAIDTASFKEIWRFATEGGEGNCNNVAAPAVVGDYLHVGTTAGYYYVLNRTTGTPMRTIDCAEPVFSSPAVGKDRVYFATLGAKVYAITPSGDVVWTWDFVKEVIGFDGDRWSGADWLAHRKDRVTWQDHFVCSRDICLAGDVIVMPAGGRTVFIEDSGDKPVLRAVGLVPKNAGTEYPATFGQSADAEGNVYVQWHRRDNAGRVETMRLAGDTVETDYVRGTETSIRDLGLLSLSPVSVRGTNVYRVRPEEGRGLCRHALKGDVTDVLCAAGAIGPAVVTRDHAVYGGLDGKLYVVPLDGSDAQACNTAFGRPLTAGLAAADGRIYAGGEDGYLYVFGSGGDAPLPTEDLRTWRIRSPLEGPLAGPEYDWYTNYGDFQGSNANNQGLKPPLRMRWARRLEGTVKHLPVCGGGRVYMHTAEGQILAVEQDTGRLLWRRWWPDVYLSFTSPLYVAGKLLVPQAGIKHSRMRCLDAATGELLWEAPLYWVAQLEPPVPAGGTREPRHLRLRVRRIRGARVGEVLHV